MITKEAMIVICTMMRTERGRKRRMALIDAPDSASTQVTAADITSAVSSVVVTASAEQMPRICRVIGFSPTSGVMRALNKRLATIQPFP